MARNQLLALANPEASFTSRIRALAPAADVHIGQTLEFASERAPHADAILIANFSPEPFCTIFPSAQRVRWVHSLFAGVDKFLSPELLASPVVLTNGRGAFSDSLAEFAIAAMLYFSKQLRRLIRNQEAGKWAQFEMRMLRGQTLGIVGYGEIGRTTAELARTFGVRVLALRRQTALSGSDPNIAAVYAPGELSQMLGECDFVLVAAPLTPETRGMIGRRELASMKSSAVIMNVGRGPVIVESALIEALESNRIAGAALDVFDQEPLPEGHAFYRLENVLLSPHCADNVPGWLEVALQPFFENFERFSKGEPLLNVVDKKAGY